MTMQAYIGLAENSGANKKTFRVLMGSYRVERQKTQTRKRTANGTADTQEGAIIKAWSLTIKCKHQTTVTGEGTLDDLRAFFERNQASGANSGRLSFWEFDDTKTHKVEMLGNLSEENVIPFLTGTEAEFLVPIVLEKVD